MIKINLLAEKGQTKKAKVSSTSIQTEGMGSSQNLLLIGLLMVGVLIAGGWWWSLKGTTAQLRNEDRKSTRLNSSH